MAYRLSYSDYPLPAAPLAPPVAPPTPESIPGGPGFSGNPQPPDVPCDPTGDGWRGPPGPTGPQGTTALIQVQDTPPPYPQPGQLWFDSSNPQLYVWFVDPTSSQWVIATAYAGGLTTDAPSDGQTYGRFNGQWASIGAFDGPYLPLTGGTVNGDVTITGSAASGNMGTFLTLTGGVSTFSMNAALGKSVRITLGGAGTGFNINPGGTATDNPLAITAGASAGLHVIDVTNSKFRTKLQKINGSYALSGAYSDDTAPMSMVLNVSGTPASTIGGYPVMRWGTTGDTAAAISSASLRLIDVEHNWGGPTMTGGRQAMLIHMNQTAKSGNSTLPTPRDAFYQALSVSSDAVFNEGGTSLAHNDTCMGHNFAFGAYARLLNTGDNGDGTSGATFWYANNGCEWDILAQAGTSVLRQFGQSIVHLQGHAVQGSVEDAALMIADQPSIIGWKTIFQIGSPLGQDPLGVGSGIMQWRAPSHPGDKIPQADYGIDIALGAISGNAFASRGFAVAGSGLTRHFQAEIAQTGSGVSVDVKNSIINLGSLVSGGPVNAEYSVGDWFGDVNTGLIVSTSTLTVGGSITAVVQQRGGYALTNPGTVVLANMNNEIGGSITVTTTGTLSNTLSLQPSGGKITSAPLTNAANDAAAASAGVPLNGWYRNGSIMMQRVA